MIEKPHGFFGVPNPSQHLTVIRSYLVIPSPGNQGKAEKLAGAARELCELLRVKVEAPGWGPVCSNLDGQNGIFVVLKGHGSMPWAMGQHMWVLYIYIYIFGIDGSRYVEGPGILSHNRLL